MSLPGYYEYELDDAVSESVARDQIITIECDKNALQAAIDYLGDKAENTDYTRNGEVVEVWGWSDDTPDGEMDWRVHLRMVSA